MSHWTQIIGIMRFSLWDCEKTRDELQAYIDEVIKYAPEITGSEGPAEIKAWVPEHGPHTTTTDCTHCIYKNTYKKVKHGYLCWHPDNYECKTVEYPAEIIVTVNGHLRDKWKDDTKKEIQELIGYFTRKTTGCGWELEMQSFRMIE